MNKLGGTGHRPSLEMTHNNMNVCSYLFIYLIYIIYGLNVLNSINLKNKYY